MHPVILLWPLVRAACVVRLASLLRPARNIPRSWRRVKEQEF